LWKRLLAQKTDSYHLDLEIQDLLHW
jgi:hypothetical protein